MTQPKQPSATETPLDVRGEHLNEHIRKLNESQQLSFTTSTVRKKWWEFWK